MTRLRLYLLLISGSAFLSCASKELVRYTCRESPLGSECYFVSKTQRIDVKHLKQSLITEHRAYEKIKPAGVFSISRAFSRSEAIGLFLGLPVLETEKAHEEFGVRPFRSVQYKGVELIESKHGKAVRIREEDGKVTCSSTGSLDLCTLGRADSCELHSIYLEVPSNSAKDIKRYRAIVMMVCVRPTVQASIAIWNSLAAYLASDRILLYVRADAQFFGGPQPYLPVFSNVPAQSPFGRTIVCANKGDGDMVRCN